MVLQWESYINWNVNDLQFFFCHLSMHCAPNVWAYVCVCARCLSALSFVFFFFSVTPPVSHLRLMSACERLGISPIYWTFGKWRRHNVHTHTWCAQTQSTRTKIANFDAVIGWVGTFWYVRSHAKAHSAQTSTLLFDFHIFYFSIIINLKFA